MVDSKFFNIPFATSGDKATIPEPVQAGGGISYTEGFGPDYERDPATDPLAKRVPRDETNEYLYQITNSLRFLQLYGLPEWYSVANGGPANYPISARVRYDAGSGMQAWISIVAANTAVPGGDATKWALDEYFNLPALEATLAEALAGTIGTKIITPRRMASAAQRGTWNYADDTGSADALVVTLAPVPVALSVGMVVRLKKGASPNATTAPTLNVNGLGASTITNASGNPLAIGDLPAGRIIQLQYDGGNWRVSGFVSSDGATQIAVNNPVFPEIKNVGNIFTFTTSTGQIIINTGNTWQHRGLIPYTSSVFSAPDRTFATAASKIHHLVWDAPGTGLATPVSTYPSGRFSLIDRTGASPAETDPSYDTTFDRMLIARVTTDGANALTVLPLINKTILSGGAALVATPSPISGNGYRAVYNPSYNWSRTPSISFNAFVVATSLAGVGGPAGVEGGANYTNIFTVNRYAASFDVLTDWNEFSNILAVQSALKYNAIA